MQIVAFGSTRGEPVACYASRRATTVPLGDGVGRELRAGQGARFERGGHHAQGSDPGMTAVMIQVDELVARVGSAGGRRLEASRGAPRAELPARTSVGCASSGPGRRRHRRRASRAPR